MHRNLIGAVRLYFDVDALPNQMGKEPTLRLAGNARSGKGDGHDIPIADGSAVRGRSGGLAQHNFHVLNVRLHL